MILVIKNKKQKKNKMEKYRYIASTIFIKY